MTASRPPRGKALLIAFVLSFAVHLIPLFNVHAGLVPLGLLWAGLWAEPTAMTAAMAAGALVLQALAGTLLFWVARGFRWWKLLGLAVALPLFTYGANLVFLIAIPLAVLVESDDRPEVGELSLLCSLPGATLAEVRSGSDLVLERAGEAWVFLHDGGGRAILTMPGCRSEQMPTGKMGSSVNQAAPGGYFLFTPRAGGLAYLAPGLEAPLEVAPPPEEKVYWRPTLSDDGKAVAWLDREPGDANLQPHRLRLRYLADGRAEAFPLTFDPRDQLEVIGADTVRGRYTLARHRNEILAVDGTGQLVWGPVSPPGIYNARWGFRHIEGGVDGGDLAGQGWVAWDGYREEGRSRVVWSLPSGSGEFVVPKGRGINSLAVAPDGRHIAFSLESRLSIGTIKSSVTLLRTADGREIYRRFHPQYARTRLAFLGNSALAMTRSQEGQAFTDVYALPSPPTAE